MIHSTTENKRPNYQSQNVLTQDKSSILLKNQIVDPNKNEIEKIVVMNQKFKTERNLNYEQNQIKIFWNSLTLIEILCWDRIESNKIQQRLT